MWKEFGNTLDQTLAIIMELIWKEKYIGKEFAIFGKGPAIKKWCRPLIPKGPISNTRGSGIVKIKGRGTRTPSLGPAWVACCSFTPSPTPIETLCRPSSLLAQPVLPDCRPASPHARLVPPWPMLLPVVLPHYHAASATHCSFSHPVCRNIATGAMTLPPLVISSPGHGNTRVKHGLRASQCEIEDSMHLIGNLILSFPLKVQNCPRPSDLF